MRQELQEIKDLIRVNRTDAAERRLETLSAKGADAAQVYFLQGYLRESQSDLEGAVEAYEKAVDTDHGFRDALFRLARLLSQRGDEDAAIELYEQCVNDAPVPVNALMNLAVLYEDQGRYELARAILTKILEAYPHHTRARAQLRDVESSIHMYLDDEHDRVKTGRNLLLDTPITDFELSVRSRNCLKQMDIHTLGDLLRTREADLLAYKNFGETSLNEIKRMLAAKNLHLGQALEEPPPVAPPEAPAAGMVVTAPVGNPALLSRPVVELELSVRSRKCLQRLGVVTIGDLTQRSEPELLSTKNFGQTSLLEIKRRLTEMGLSLRLSDR